MKVSISVTNYSWPDGTAALARDLRFVASQVDDAGIDTLWVPDHLLQMDPNATIEQPMLEAYTTLGFLAAMTNHVKLGTLVTWAAIRPPALVVKAVSTLDALSGGRAWLGLGAGYAGDEARLMGLPFDMRERFDRVEEVAQLAIRMWSGDETPFDGLHDHYERPIGVPAPITRPRILIGGMGEKRTLPLVARYADACNLFDVPDGGATVRHKIDVLHKACEAAKRDPKEIEITLSSRLAPEETAEDFADRCRALEHGGIDQVILVTTGPWEKDEFDIVFEAVANLARA